ncbi:YczE/YyaS/YitT family protein [Acidaminobacter hydrogenoformans]|uniref:Uncharacterized membrane protein YczE n=1 Tax=Acidaminobacter hydrogenoformans DSM 2784 TaxID=1120920 RepID=A0A1G5RSQ6_9FIRM|nr:hypothetical protein [Acidaminobacter hydrogenoformans]SCZ76329.1 Uncharacterized membrane protein YczE [Acidaminobacter hydrogenoformans DSM 2784]
MEQTTSPIIHYLKNLPRLFFGYFLYALGIALTVDANLGLAPWDVLHQGLSQTLGITFGMASIGVGIIIVMLNVRLGERVGWGTIGNMIFIGVFLDLLFGSGLLPSLESVPLRVIQLFVGMFTIGLASFVYLGCGMGSGPRDGLMVALTKKTGKPVGMIRSGIELCVLAVGYFLGGSIGVGTVLTALGIGFAVQTVFRLVRFDVKGQRHRFVDEDLAWVRAKG